MHAQYLIEHKSLLTKHAVNAGKLGGWVVVTLLDNLLHDLDIQVSITTRVVYV